jgi:serine/threonine-protein kinase
VTVPNVVGKKEADATSAMTSAGLKPKVYKQYSSTVAAGLVIEQVPTAGTTTASGAEVAISVSLGKETGSGLIAVPNVITMTEADATAAIKAAGFVAEVIEQVSAEPPGTVTDQLPVYGSEAPKGSTVVIAVASAAPPE